MIRFCNPVTDDKPELGSLLSSDPTRPRAVIRRRRPYIEFAATRGYEAISGPKLKATVAVEPAPNRCAGFLVDNAERLDSHSANQINLRIYTYPERKKREVADSNPGPLILARSALKQLSSSSSSQLCPDTFQGHINQCRSDINTTD
jgi:hypothetical protein